MHLFSHGTLFVPSTLKYVKALSQKLIYFMGPSGSGKDSVMSWLLAHAPEGVSLRYARRVVTREQEDPNSVDIAVSKQVFNNYLDKQQLAMNWSANGLNYGIKRNELTALRDDEYLLINGSRAYYATAKFLFPDLFAVHITAQLETLKTRLQQRNRESEDSIAKRLYRATQIQPGGQLDGLELSNDGEVEQCAQKIWMEIQKIKD